MRYFNSLYSLYVNFIIFFCCLREYAKTINRPYRLRYEPFTQSIKIIDNINIINEIKKEIDMDIETLIELF